MYELHDNAHVLCECPNCGRKALAQVSSKRYECLWCDFNRDLSRRHRPTPTRGLDGGAFFFVLVAVFVGLVIVGG